jgi:hypothetical protein
MACRLHQVAELENGDRRDAWALSRRLSGFLRNPRVRPDEEFAFSFVGTRRIAVSWFRCDSEGSLRQFVMLSFPKQKLPVLVRRSLQRWSKSGYSVTGNSFSNK